MRNSWEKIEEIRHNRKPHVGTQDHIRIVCTKGRIHAMMNKTFKCHRCDQEDDLNGDVVHVMPPPDVAGSLMEVTQIHYMCLSASCVYDKFKQ